MSTTKLPPPPPSPQHHVQNRDAAYGGKTTARMNKGKIMRKLLGQPAPSQTQSTDQTIADLSQLRPITSQSTSHHIGAPIACLDRSPDGHRAVIAGAKVFKIIRVEGSTIKEETDLRAGIISYATTHDLTAATHDQLNIRAVKWSHGVLDSTIITASGNGRITVYDLNHGGEGYEVARIQEHARQVHKLAINPFRCNWLLSASQDGTVRSFDLRTPPAGRHGHNPAFRTSQIFKCNADAVRDVKWSPTDGMEFACCTDSGSVQKWDMRKTGAPLLKIPAHQTSCSSVSWHPDGEHLVSGGADQLCHVWDLGKKADRNQKPRYTFTTPAPISTVSWRPACWSATAQGYRAAQVAVAYDDSSATKTQNSTVHLWDLARPSLPFKVIEQWGSAPTGLLWSSRDLLWSVDKDGRFTQTDVAFMPKVIDRRSLSTFSFSPSGDVLMMLEERQTARRRSRPTITPSEVSPSFDSGSGPLLSVSRSDSEEDVVGSFLGSRPRKTKKRRNSTKSFSSTPPTTTGMAEHKVMPLDDAVKTTGIYKSQQVMAVGHAPGTTKRVTYRHLSSGYLILLDKYIRQESKPGDPSVQLAHLTNSFAEISEGVGHYRLAQTWRLLGYTVGLLLTRRAEYHRQQRLLPETPPKNEQASEPPIAPKPRGHEIRRKRRGWETPQKKSRAPSPVPTPPRHHSAITIIPDDIESTSNVATPLVRPVRDQIVSQTREAMHTSINVDDDVLSLSTTLLPSTPSPIPVPGAVQNNVESSPSIDDYDFYGIDSVSPVVNFNAPQRKPPLRLDYPIERDSQPIIHPLQRHDSGESFQMFSTSSDSQQTKFLSSSTSDQGQPQGVSLRDRVSTWENSLSSQPRRRLDSETLTDATDVTDGSSVVQTATSSVAASTEGHGGVSFDPAVPPVFHLQEPSLQSETQAIELKPVEVPPASPVATEKPPADPNIIESDFLPQPNDPGFSFAPLDPITLLERSIEFECQSGSLTAAIMVLLFVPLLPPDTIDPIWANAIMGQYHHRLTQLLLFVEAAMLRNLCVSRYPSVFAMSQQNVNFGFFCTECEKPFDNDPLIPNSQWWCPRCRGPIDGCPICKHRELQDVNGYEGEDEEASKLNLWWYCPGCGHGGHAACMEAWHGPSNSSSSKSKINTSNSSMERPTNSDGCCPLEGCLHPCLPGPWRTEFYNQKKAIKGREMNAAIRESSRLTPMGRGAALGRGIVRRDDKEVTQSKAVEGVRIALGVRVGGEGRLERKKSVKLVIPGEDGA
ncbi:hypothetical protein HYALB_00012594 [Hymenoscyphus albidus]|uniref:WD40 repeat-like protein n=1 Tax=Hymenoscyphus albidus TaxID=595503 RepID=A0A9N9LU35_9HELO|nr:hypothetical protein HYALB_00012594 [Hymenoscyphus albidus]